MEKSEQPNTGTKEAAKEQPGKGVKGADVQATVVNGFKDLDNKTLIGIAENGKARDVTRIAALREIHARPGCQYSGLERLSVATLQAVVKTDTVPDDLRAAAADALALPRAADKVDEPPKS